MAPWSPAVHPAAQGDGAVVGQVSHEVPAVRVAQGTLLGAHRHPLHGTVGQQASQMHAQEGLPPAQASLGIREADRLGLLGPASHEGWRSRWISTSTTRARWERMR